MLQKEQIDAMAMAARRTLRTVEPWQDRQATAGLAYAARDRARDVLELIEHIAALERVE